MRILVIGYGSIGARHASLLEEDGHQVDVLTQSSHCPHATLKDLSAAQTLEYQGVLVATATSGHGKTLEDVREAGFICPVLIEKPLFDRPTLLPPYSPEKVHVAYNLRFHPVWTQVRKHLAGRTIYSINAYVGQYLPEWRPGRDYRQIYSADKNQGGGALRDLSHELDYVQWLAGPWKRVSAIGGHFSSLEITSDDVFGLLLETARCPMVLLQMNYLDRHPGGRRELIINAEEVTLKIDFRNLALTINGEKLEYFQVGRNQTYVSQMRAWLGGHSGDLCSYEEGLETVKLIAAAEEAAQGHKWVVNEN